MRTVFSILLVLVCVVTGKAGEKVLDKDLEPLKEQVMLTLRHIYNADSASASAEISSLKAQMGDHPVIGVLQALKLRWAYGASYKKPPASTGTLEMLARVTEQVEDKDKKLRTDEMKFLAMAAYGLMAEQYYLAEKSYKAAGAAKSMYGYLKEGFELCDEYPEFLCTTGIYNYFRVTFPERHPLYKPFVWFFRSGDLEQGLNQLEEASEKAVYSGTESRFYLTHVLLRYESDFARAFPHAKYLHEVFPNNKVFASLYAEACVRVNDYEKASHLGSLISKGNDEELRKLGSLFQGFQAKENGDLEKAKRLFLFATEMDLSRNKYFEHFQSMAWLELGRLELDEGNDTKAKEYLKKANKVKRYDVVGKALEELL
ncbi:hypothetical protein FUAX_34310 [Fulvitalea axinellae]|uniref:Tetratricopeptide repeat protein n=1 Tax=Fulvitalea axinellae TaxID=1182444 RepID=A0AAU9D8V4_9BACT|nr:hypothetical protein FUAX_34310 [Fulvitalea axinellae]